MDPSLIRIGWEMGHDETHDIPYYYNSRTGQTQWEIPMIEVFDSSDAASTDWVELHDESTGRKYYGNSKTG